jgi:hypothetical protein
MSAHNTYGVWWPIKNEEPTRDSCCEHQCSGSGHYDKLLHSPKRIATSSYGHTSLIPAAAPLAALPGASRRCAGVRHVPRRVHRRRGLRCGCLLGQHPLVPARDQESREREAEPKERHTQSKQNWRCSALQITTQRTLVQWHSRTQGTARPVLCPATTAARRPTAPHSRSRSTRQAQSIWAFVGSEQKAQPAARRGLDGYKQKTQPTTRACLSTCCRRRTSCPFPAETNEALIPATTGGGDVVGGGLQCSAASWPQ